jgi:hypothetical protein
LTRATLGEAPPAIDRNVHGEGRTISEPRPGAGRFGAREGEPAYVSLKGAMLLENSLLVLVLIGVVLTMGALTAEIKSPDLDLNIQLNVVLNLAVS